MGKLFGILLMILAIYVGLTVYDKGVDRAFGGVFAGFKKEAPRHAAAAPQHAAMAARDDRGSSASDDTEERARPAPITERVRERVTGAMEQGARRSAGQ